MNRSFRLTFNCHIESYANYLLSIFFSSLFQNRTGVDFIAQIMQNRNADFVSATSVLVLPDYAWRIEGDDILLCKKNNENKLLTNRSIARTIPDISIKRKRCEAENSVRLKSNQYPEQTAGIIKNKKLYWFQQSLAWPK